MPDIETGNRFIEDQPAWLIAAHGRPDLAEDASQLHPLLFSAGQGLVGASLKSGQVHPIEGGTDAALPFRGRLRSVLQTEADNLLDRQRKGELCVLGQDSPQVGEPFR